MDLDDEWEILPEDGFPLIHDDGAKNVFSSKYGGGPKLVFHPNYFDICSSPENQTTADREVESKESMVKAVDDQLRKEIRNLPIQVCVMSEKVKAPNTGAVETDQIQKAVSQVSFKQSKEPQPQFADMTGVESPKSIGREIMPQNDARTFPLEQEGKTGSRMNIEKEDSDSDSDLKEEMIWKEKNDGHNIWKRSLTGIGAICSFGVAAAATVCVIILGSHHGSKHHHQQNHKLRFQMYAEDKRFKQVVQQATRLNEAISAMREVPLTRAHVTYGGYYHGL